MPTEQDARAEARAYATVEEAGRRLHLVRYWNATAESIGVVVSIALHEGEPMEWGAYIGGALTPGDYERVLRMIHRFGAKLTEDEARAFVPLAQQPETRNGYRR